MAQESAPLSNVEKPLPQPAQAARAFVERDAMPPNAPLHARRPMIAQILPDAAQFVHHRDAELLQAIGLADAGQLEQLRRGDRARRHDDLARGTCLELLSLHAVTHADAAPALEQQALRMRAGVDAQIATRARRGEVGARSRIAKATADRALRHRNAFLALAIVIVVARNADALGRGEEAVVERPALVAVGDLQRP